MPKVVIDGVEYVPKASTHQSEATNADAEYALGRLVLLFHLYGTSGMSRGARGCIWDALERLDPELAKMDPSTFGAVWDARWGDGAG